MALIRDYILYYSRGFWWFVWRVCHEVESASTGIQEEISLKASNYRGYSPSRPYSSGLLSKYVLEDQHDRDDGNTLQGVRGAT